MPRAAILGLVSAAAAMKLHPDLSLVTDVLARQGTPENLTCVEDLTFHGGQNHAYSNLGGLGPDTDKPKELRYRNIGVDHKSGSELDLVVKNDTRYQTSNPQYNGVSAGTHVGQISCDVGTDVVTTVSFVEHDTDTPVTLDLVKLTFCDVDHFSLARAEIYTVDVDAFYIVSEGPDFTYEFKDLDGNELAESAMGVETVAALHAGRFVKRYFKQGGGQFRVKVTSGAQGFGCDSPKDFSDLTIIAYNETEQCQAPPDYYANHQDLVVDQAKRCFAFELKNSFSTRLVFQAGQDGVQTGKSRNMIISGASTFFNHETPCPTPSTTMPLTTTEAPITMDEPDTTTEAGTPAPTASITGDPHATNIDGQRFNVVRAGTHEFLRLPRLSHVSAAAEPAEPLVQVMGRVEAAQGSCAMPFVREVLVAGRLLGSLGTLRFGTSGGAPGADGAILLGLNGSEVGPEEFARRAESVATVRVPQQPGRGSVGSNIRRRTFLSVQLHVGHAKMSIGWVHRSVPNGAMVNHLNFDVSNLRQLSKELGMDIGGILGRDDHALATTPGPECAGHTTDLHATSSWSGGLTPPLPAGSISASL